ncbi:hypothetical protein PR048_003010 [Dryococelus australis]|uniref:Uncharacterized protein n=1 Tax=Dryococelus australis TaxID=614101 RepID=A0ABQ9ILV6_9NEOP|nr:hypothetical protein PR048_003010 [Dryococelus australis]
MKAGGDKSFKKKVFPRLLKQTLNAMEENLRSNFVSRFKKGGIHALNKKIVLERLSDHKVGTGRNVDVDGSLNNFLKEQRFSDEGTSSEAHGHKKRLKVPAGRNVSAADFMTSEDESSSSLSCDEEMRATVIHIEQPTEQGTWVTVAFLYD